MYHGEIPNAGKWNRFHRVTSAIYLKDELVDTQDVYVKHGEEYTISALIPGVDTRSAKLTLDILGSPSELELNQPNFTIPANKMVADLDLIFKWEGDTGTLSKSALHSNLTDDINEVYIAQYSKDDITSLYSDIDLSKAIDISEEQNGSVKLVKYNDKGIVKAYVYSDALLTDYITSCQDLSNIIPESNTNIKKVILGEKLLGVASCSELFSNCKNLEEIRVLCDTSKVRSMYHMFWHCENATTIDISELKTNRVTNMEGLLGFCYKLPSIDLSNFETFQVTTMKQMFTNMRALTNLDISNFNTASCTDMHDMFSELTSITELDVSNLDTQNAVDLTGMFYGCTSIKHLDISHFNISKAKKLTSMINKCKALESIELFNGSNFASGADISGMFDYCESLKELYLRNWDTTHCSGEYGAEHNIFEHMYSLEKVVSGANTTIVYYLRGTWYDEHYYKYTGITYGHVPVAHATYTSYYPIVGLDFAKLNENIGDSKQLEIGTVSSYPDGGTEPIDISFEGNNGALLSKVGDIAYVYANFIGSETTKRPIFLYPYLKSKENDDSSQLAINSDTALLTSSAKVEKVVFGREAFLSNNIGYLFEGNKVIREVAFDSPKIAGDAMNRLAYTFYECSNLQKVDFSGMPVYLESFPYMFYNCSNLEELDLTTWDTTKLEEDPVYELDSARKAIQSIFDGTTSLRRVTIGDKFISQPEWFNGAERGGYWVNQNGENFEDIPSIAGTYTFQSGQIPASFILKLPQLHTPIIKFINHLGEVIKEIPFLDSGIESQYPESQTESGYWDEIIKNEEGDYEIWWVDATGTTAIIEEEFNEDLNIGDYTEENSNETSNPEEQQNNQDLKSTEGIEGTEGEFLLAN